MEVSEEYTNHSRGSAEARIQISGKISNDSPIAQALIGKTISLSSDLRVTLW